MSYHNCVNKMYFHLMPTFPTLTIFLKRSMSLSTLMIRQCHKTTTQANDNQALFL